MSLYQFMCVEFFPESIAFEHRCGDANRLTFILALEYFSQTQEQPTVLVLFDIHLQRTILRKLHWLISCSLVLNNF